MYIRKEISLLINDCIMNVNKNTNKVVVINCFFKYFDNFH